MATGDLLNKIINGDCLEVVRYIDNKSIDMILCDLPYGTTACKWDIIIPFAPAIAAINTWRNFIGIEIDKHFCETAKNRVNERLSALL
jgi:DNA modification methylase